MKDLGQQTKLPLRSQQVWKEQRKILWGGSSAGEIRKQKCRKDSTPPKPEEICLWVVECSEFVCLGSGTDD